MGLYTSESGDLLGKHMQRTHQNTRLVTEALAFVIGDILIALLSFGIAAFLTHAGSFIANVVPTLTWIAAWLVWRAYQGLYPGYGKSPQTELRLHTIATVSIALMQLAAALTFSHLISSALEIVLQWFIILILSLITRYGVRNLLIRSGQFGRDVTVIGAGNSSFLLIEHLLSHPEYGLRPIVAYDDNMSLHGQTIYGVPIQGNIELALHSPQTSHALIAIPGARAEVQQWLINSVYANFPITWVIPDLFGVPNQAMQPHNIGSIASLEIKNNLSSARAQSVKRTIDLLGAGIGTILISPILLVIVIAIRLDSPGPAVYRARRLGRNGQLFDCFKFRSMHRDAEAKLQEVLASDPALKAEFEATHKLKDDPRVTRVGAFLRKTSLDEFPQLFNVLKGEMSLVGPRPIVTAEIEKYGDVYEIYKQVHPGMTGYWQANGRSDTSYDERVGMDRFYVTNWSPWLDIVVLIQTVKVVLMGKGAY